MCVYFSGVSKATWSGSVCAYFYKSACIEDPALLQSRLKKCELSPPGWTFIDNQTSSLVSVQLYKLPQFASDAGVVYIVEINQTMSWKLKFGECDWGIHSVHPVLIRSHLPTHPFPVRIVMH